jgi:hypothetical protein
MIIDVKAISFFFTKIFISTLFIQCTPTLAKEDMS